MSTYPGGVHLYLSFLSTSTSPRYFFILEHETTGRVVFGLRQIPPNPPTLVRCPASCTCVPC
jgi:hypothetical protein